MGWGVGGDGVEGEEGELADVTDGNTHDRTPESPSPLLPARRKYGSPPSSGLRRAGKPAVWCPASGSPTGVAARIVRSRLFIVPHFIQSERRRLA